MEQDLEEACVYIYAAMGLYEEAVDLALKVWGVGGGGGGGCDIYAAMGLYEEAVDLALKVWGGGGGGGGTMPGWTPGGCQLTCGHFVDGEC